MKKLKINTFTKYLLSYILPFVLPILLLSIYVNDSLFMEISNLYEQQSQMELKEIGIQINDSLERLQMISEHILLNNSINPQLNLENVHKSINTIEELKKYKISNNTIKELLLYFEDDNYIYTSSSTYPIYDLSKLSYFNKNMGEKIIKNVFSENYVYDISDSLNYFSKYSDYNIISQVIKVKNKNVLIMFVLDDKIFNNLFDDDVYFFVDKYNNIMFKNTEHNIKRFEDDSRYLKSTYFLDKHGFVFYKFSNYYVIFQNFNKIKRTFIILLGIVTFFGITMVVIGMKINYVPLNAVMKKIVTNQKTGDDIKDIQNAVGIIIDENKNLKQKAEIKKFLFSLLNGLVTEKSDFINTINTLKLEKLNCNLYYVAILYFKDYDITGNDNKVLTYSHNEIFHFIQSVLSENADGYVVDTFSKGRVIFIGCDNDNNQHSIVYNMMNIQDKLKEKVDKVNICLGNTYDDFLQIPKSYLDASLAVDYRFIKGNNTIIESKNLPLNQEFERMYPKTLFEQIQFYLKSGDMDKLYDSLNQFTAYIKTEDLPLYYIKGLCYQLINMISEIVEKINLQINTQKNKLSYACVLINYDTVEELVNAIQNIANNINMYIKENEEKNGNPTIIKIKNFINDNAFNQNFSVHLLADEFNMSISSISSFVKYHTGTTILEYITQIRMNEARRLLLTNRYTVNKITEMVGYVNVSSFIRKFKQYYGFTPKEYIKQNEGTVIDE